MKESQFRVLMHSGQYVDINLLSKGIYTTALPKLYGRGTTIDAIENNAKISRTMTGDLFVSIEFFSNLKLCTLQDVSLVGQF